MEFGKRHDTTDTRTFARTNLLMTCYGETGVMDFGIHSTLHLSFIQGRLNLGGMTQNAS